MFRFTIRDLLWATVVIGLALGWWVSNHWAQPAAVAPASCTVNVRLGENQFQAEGPPEVVKEHLSIFIETVHPSPPLTLPAGFGGAAGGEAAAIGASGAEAVGAGAYPAGGAATP